MLYDFKFYNPTKIHFGRESLGKLKEELSNYGDTILLAYGKAAIKRIGLYDKVVTILKDSGKTIIELEGVMPNPTYAKVLEGTELVRKHNVDLILAVGGGSVVDYAKAVAGSAYCEEDAYQRYWIDRKAVECKTVPVASILTMVGTGSEMNGGSVITNDDLKLKIGYGFPQSVFPKFSILNPEFTYSIPKYQMVSGIYDILSHLMEQYFSGEEISTSDYIMEGLLRSVIDNARVAIKEPENYEARSNIMWSSTVAINTLCAASKPGDWAVHSIEHQLGAYTDCAHGMGLAAISLPYYRHIYKYGLDKFVRFAEVVWGVSSEGKTKDDVALEGISCLEAFIDECGIVKSLKELGATKEMLPLIAESTNASSNGYKELSPSEILDVLEQCF